MERTNQRKQTALLFLSLSFFDCVGLLGNYQFSDGYFNVNSGDYFIHPWNPFYFFKPSFNNGKVLKFNATLFWIVQGTLFLFLVSLMGMGVHRAIWQAGLSSDSFSQMMDGSKTWSSSFIIIGLLLMVSMDYYLVYLVVKKKKKNRCPAD